MGLKISLCKETIFIQITIFLTNKMDYVKLETQIFYILLCEHPKFQAMSPLYVRFLISFPFTFELESFNFVSSQAWVKLHEINKRAVLYSLL